MHRLVDHAVLVEHLLGFSEQNDGNLDGDLDVGVETNEVDMVDFTTHGVPLKLFDDAELAAAVDLERDQTVEPGLGGEDATQLGVLDAHGDGIGTEAVDHGGNLALATQTTGSTGALGASGGCGENELGHGGRTPMGTADKCGETDPPC